MSKSICINVLSLSFLFLWGWLDHFSTLIFPPITAPTSASIEDVGVLSSTWSSRRRIMLPGLTFWGSALCHLEMFSPVLSLIGRFLFWQIPINVDCSRKVLVRNMNRFPVVIFLHVQKDTMGQNNALFVVGPHKSVEKYITLNLNNFGKYFRFGIILLILTLVAL